MVKRRIILIVKTLIVMALVSQFLNKFKNIESTLGEPASLSNPVFQKGMSYVSWPPRFDSAESDESLRLLRLTNTEWVAVCLFQIENQL